MTTREKPTDETLMAYADGELEPARSAEVEAAMAENPEIARRVEQHKALRKKLGAAFDPVLNETVPDALVTAIRSAPAKPRDQAAREATVTDLRRVRAARAAEAKGASTARETSAPRRHWTWLEWGAMAASIAAGAVIAHLAMKSPIERRIDTDDGQLVAQADLEQALSNQLAGDQSANAPVQIGVTFKTKAGDHCRTFIVKERSPLGGLACRQGDEWRVQVLAATTATAGPDGSYKPAGADMPAAVITAVEQQIEGEPFDTSAEAAARGKDWK
jgi:anti-sigma factor RsiW